MQAPILFDPSNAQHKSYLSQMAEIHMACIETDKTIATFLPPLDHTRITAWYKEQALPVEYGAREIILQLVTVGEGSNSKECVGGFVMLVRRVGTDSKLMTETGPFRGDVLKLLVSPNHRGKGIARRVMEKLEEVALKTGVSLLASLDLRRHWRQSFDYLTMYYRSS